MEEIKEIISKCRYGRVYVKRMLNQAVETIDEYPQEFSEMVGFSTKVIRILNDVEAIANSLDRKDNHEELPQPQPD